MSKKKEARVFEKSLKEFSSVVAIDPGYANFGIAFGNPIQTKLLTFKSSIPRYERYKTIIGTFLKLMHQFDDPPLVLIEHYSFGSGVHRLIDLAGVGELLKYRCQTVFGFWPVEVPPTTLKKYITGKGNSPKEQVMLGLYKKFKKEFKTSHEGEAYALAQMGLDILNRKESTLKLLNITFPK